MDTHKQQAKQDGAKCTSSAIITRGNYQVFIIEEYPCESRQRLRAREEYHRSLSENAVNKVKAFRTEDEKKAYKAQWHKQNYTPHPRVPLTTEEKEQKKKDDYQKNKEYHKQYRDQHKETHKEYVKNHYEKNKAKYLEKAKAQREAVKNDPELLAKEREYKKLKAREYREKKKLASQK
jgi:hypothetical protein